MKSVKFFSLLVAAAIVLTPACALARTHVSFSLNLFEHLRPMCAPVPVIVAPPPRPVYFCPPPPPVPYYQQRTVVKEYHHHYFPMYPGQPVPEPYYP